jgi:spermidine dehydrogenase
MAMSRDAGRPGDQHLGLNAEITRRDFIGATAIGAGAGLLAMAAPYAARAQAPAPGAPWPPRDLGADWSGPGGLGDYASSNGNTHEVVNSAHAIAQGLYTPLPGDTIDTGEVYDVVAVGGGFAGLSAAYTVMDQGEQRCLVLDNHPIFGGEAKMNKFEVDGYTLYAPQGSNDFLLPNEAARAVEVVHPYWDKLGIPSDLDFVETSERLKGRIKVARDNFGSQIHQIRAASTAHYYFDEDGYGGVWARDPWENGFRDAPIPESEKQELMRFVAHAQIPEQCPKDGWDRWLDSMTYKDYVEKVMGYSPRMTAYMDMIAAAGAFACSSDAFSAYGAYDFGYPGTVPYYGENGFELIDQFQYATFPGGNAGIARYFVKAMIPDAIAGGYNHTDIHDNALNFEALDRPGNRIRIRTGATVVHVRHDGAPDEAETLTVAYEKGGRIHSLKCRSVVMCSGGWVNTHVCRDLTPELRAAYEAFHHGPMLTVNVALRNWRFLEKLGASAVRWFGGELGFWTNVRQPMKMDGSTMPLDPDKPVVLSVYIALPTPGLSAGEQGRLGRMKLFSMSFRDIELWVRRHFTQLFSEFGFDARRDIAGIVANRWGHAYVCPGPGFYFDRDGRKSPRNTVREGYGRVFFGHSEIAGRQMWGVAAREGQRAAMQALATI